MTPRGAAQGVTMRDVPGPSNPLGLFLDSVILPALLERFLDQRRDGPGETMRSEAVPAEGEVSV
jgi:hypothetical protein